MARLTKREQIELENAAVVEKRIRLHDKVMGQLLSEAMKGNREGASRLAYQIVKKLQTSAEFKLIDEIFTTSTKY